MSFKIAWVVSCGFHSVSALDSSSSTFKRLDSSSFFSPDSLDPNIYLSIQSLGAQCPNQFLFLYFCCLQPIEFVSPLLSSTLSDYTSVCSWFFFILIHVHMSKPSHFLHSFIEWRFYSKQRNSPEETFNQSCFQVCSSVHRRNCS